MVENKKVITRSLIVLFLSLSIVYSLTYQKKERIFKVKDWSQVVNYTWVTDNIWTQDLSWWFIVENTEDFDENIDELELTKSVSLWDAQVDWTVDSAIHVDNITESSNSVSLASKNSNILPGTTEYFGTLDIVNILWKNPEFTLQDTKWNFFAYYGDYLDFIQTVETLGWNVYEMKTESEILQNQLFGDRVSFINLSMFKDVWVLMVVRIDGDVWLLQIPADKYHYSKEYLKSLFIR